jgi:hypothetical protein
VIGRGFRRDGNWRGHRQKQSYTIGRGEFNARSLERK